MDEGTKDDGVEDNNNRVEVGPPATEKKELGASAGSHDQLIDSGAVGSCDQRVDDGAVGTGNQELEASSGSGTRPIRPVLSINAKEFIPRSQGSRTSPAVVNPSAAAATTWTGAGYEGGMGFHSPPLHGASPPRDHSYPLGYGDAEHYQPPSPPLVPGHEPPHLRGYGYGEHHQQPPIPPFYGSPFLFSPYPPSYHGYGGYHAHLPPMLNSDSRSTSPTQHTPPHHSSPAGHQGGSSHTSSSCGQHNDSSEYPSPTSGGTGSGHSLDRTVAVPPIINPPKMKADKPSFFDTVRYGAETATELEKLQNKMCIFLKNQNLKNQDATSFGPCLQVDFLELLCYDKEFAKDVCNGKGTHDYWLRKAANKFCNENGFPTDNASIQFINMPYSIYSASSVLSLSPCSKKVFLCGNRLAKDVATAHGREKLRIILWDILDLLLSGESWEEKLTIHDMMFAQVTKDPKSLKLVIAKRSGTRKKEDPRVGIKPLQEIWTAVEPYYKVGKNGLPLYMAQLKISLNGATELSEDLVLYLRYHPSLCSSVGRKILVDGIHQARKEFKMEKLPGFYSCFMNKPYKGDWREAAKEMDILKQLHDFRFEAPAQMKSANKEKGKTDSLDNESSRNVEKMQKIGEEEKGGIASEDECKRTQEDRTVEDKGKQISEVQNVEKIQNVSEKRNTTSGNCEGKKIEKERTGVDKAKQNSEEKENYLDSSWSLLGYNRNGHQHLGQYVVVQDPDEVELFLAAFFEDFLPDMIDKLLTACKMTECLQVPGRLTRLAYYLMIKNLPALKGQNEAPAKK